MCDRYYCHLAPGLTLDGIRRLGLVPRAERPSSFDRTGAIESSQSPDKLKRNIIASIRVAVAYGINEFGMEQEGGITESWIKSTLESPFFDIEAFEMVYSGGDSQNEELLARNAYTARIDVIFRSCLTSYFLRACGKRKQVIAGKKASASDPKVMTIANEIGKHEHSFLYKLCRSKYKFYNSIEEDVSSRYIYLFRESGFEAMKKILTIHGTSSYPLSY